MQKKRRNNYSLHFSGPIGSEATKTKQEERTVDDVEFYKKFFEAVEKEIKILAAK